MKARIVTKIPERVLLFAIDKTVQEKLNGILQMIVTFIGIRGICHLSLLWFNGRTTN